MPIDRVALAVDQPLQPVEFQPEAFSDGGSAFVLAERMPIDRAAAAVDQPLQPLLVQPDAFSDCGSAPASIARALDSTMGPPTHQPAIQPAIPSAFASTPEGERTPIDGIALALCQPPQPALVQPEAFSVGISD